MTYGTETTNGSMSRNITVIQGSIEISDDPTVTLTTILGSCVAVCMWDEEMKVGGMNHFLLAEGRDHNAIKYGAYAMEMLINRLVRAGARRNCLQSKVFGGAAVSNFASDIGKKNGDFAINFLNTEGIPCLGQSLGGTKARRVRFVPTTGSAQMLFVLPTEVQTEKPSEAGIAADITMF
ncbi:chemotaxis protein CheD [Yoonia sp. BS5-3]|uniref:Probable chemoreceptor glutamine deamidase CheD n=1 Tax=Yoonia phaeophyticola TaxID=3137369 RepID=A0ABZ2V421_9RHOB